MLANRLLSTNAGKEVKFVGRYIEGFAGLTTDKTITYNGKLSGGFSPSVSVGDFVFVHCSVANNDTDGADKDFVINGYTKQAELFQADSNSTTLLLAYKFLASIENTVVLSGGTQSTSAGGVICVSVFRDVGDNSFDHLTFDVSDKAALSPNTGKPNPPSITPVTDGALILVAGAGAGGGLTSYTSTDLTAFVSAKGDGAVYDSCLGVGHRIGKAGEAFDASAFGLVGNNSSTGSAIAAVRVLRPY